MQAESDGMRAKKKGRKLNTGCIADKNMPYGLNLEITDEEQEYYSLTKKVFEWLAPHYDTVTMPFAGLRDTVVEFTGAKGGSRILDVATGTGKQAFAFAKRDYDVTGIDLSEAMLSVAKKKNKYENARFEVADATSLPFEDGSFDVSCISFALHDMPPGVRERVLKEMFRVTRPVGLILIVDYALPENRIWRFLVYHFVRLYERYYYPEFIKSDLDAVLRRLGIGIKEKQSVLLGTGRIIKGIKITQSDMR